MCVSAHLHVTGSPELDCTFIGNERDCELLFNVLSDMNPWHDNNKLQITRIC